MQDDAKPVAWMYERERNEVESAATVINVTRWSKEQDGWTETPLYAHPPAPAQPELVELVKLLADVLEKELGDRADPSLDEEELIGWLGEEYGRQTIAGRIRLSQARERLAALAGVR